MKNLMRLFLLGTASLFLVGGAIAGDVPTRNADNVRQRLPQDEIIYLIMPDRFENGDPSNDLGGLSGDRLVTGYDPTDKAFYHGGDLKGVMKRLDYIQSLGATAVWLTPIFKNKPVQKGSEGYSAGYHGYWITDFTHVDPHFGSNDDLKALIAALHARGMKFYMDIVLNHTANIIQYRECEVCAYRSRADYPYSLQGGDPKKPINPGFLGDSVSTQANFDRLKNPAYAYTPYVPEGEKHAKTPEWLNDPIYYHNRGNSTFEGENSTLGDFYGLDDLMSENPKVVDGFVDIYGRWIDQFDIDGFRIDTEQHVPSAFWQRFIPAMEARAKARGLTNFHIFGEVMTGDPDVAKLARHTREDKLPSVMDYALAAAIRQTVGGNAGTDALARIFADDPLYANGADTAIQNTTLTGNFDVGRFPWFAHKSFPEATEDEVIRRVILAHAMIFTLRGVPVVYYGDEQGFPSTGEDQAAREDMFASRVASYNREQLLGTSTTTAAAHFGSDNPVFKAIAELAALRKSEPALARGRQIVRSSSPKPGLFAVSRIDPVSGREVVVVFNTSAQPIEAQVEVEYASQSFKPLHGTCSTHVRAPGSLHVSLDGLAYAVCAAV